MNYIGNEPWKILIADDEKDIHRIVTMVLKNVSFQERAITFLSAYSGEEAKKIIEENTDIALILVDIVMEADDSGLHVVKYVRETLENRLTRIIIYTGQPGLTPVEKVIHLYDINDYRVKSEITDEKLLTFVIASLRSYRDITELESLRNNQEQIINERTEELERANKELTEEIKERKHAVERKDKLLEELETVNRELKDFAYIVSHDLKAPLRAIRSLAEWIADDYKDMFDDDGKEQISLLLSRVNRMHDLIEGILQYSRVGRIKEEQVEIDLNLLLQEVIEMLAPPENIKVTIESPLPLIVSERTRIAQVFQNLISNSIKHMDKPDGNIKVVCNNNEENLIFTIEDNGPGIEEKHFEKIFQIFQTLKPRDEVESTGIGLTLVKKIIEMYGGKVWVESEVGKGSRFFFTYPKRN